MKKFILGLIIFGLVCISILIFVFSFFKLNGYTDPFYLRFTSPRQSSLIIGTSRAAQGIMPSILNSKLKRNDVYNYSFTLAHSPFGPTYYGSIQRKIKRDSHNGIFIIAIDPWSISSDTLDPNDSSDFPELNLALGKTKMVNISPNFQYLIESYGKPLVNLMKKEADTTTFLHNDGWLEVTVRMDSISFSNRIEEKEIEYDNNASKYKFSEVRWRYLLKTIQFLKQHGNVYLVRLPVHEKIFEIENRFMPGFNRKVNELSIITKTEFLNLTDSNSLYQYVDGNHLYKKSSRTVSVKIADWIKM